MATAVSTRADEAHRFRQDQTGIRSKKLLIWSNTGEIHPRAIKLGLIPGCPANEGLVRSHLSIRCPPKDGQTDTQFMYPT